jgi:hypothetical protein
MHALKRVKELLFALKQQLAYVTKWSLGCAPTVQEELVRAPSQLTFPRPSTSDHWSIVVVPTLANTWFAPTVTKE